VYINEDGQVGYECYASGETEHNDFPAYLLFSQNPMEEAQKQIDEREAFLRTHREKLAREEERQEEARERKKYEELKKKYG
jgi:hypothetical protein